MAVTLLSRALVLLASAPHVEVRGAERVRVTGLRGVVALLLSRRHLGDALRLLDGERPRGGGPGRDEILGALRRWPTTCLVRTLAGYARLRAAGEDARFVIGVRPQGGDLVGHAWLECAGVPVGEPGDPRLRYAVAFVHPGAPALEVPAVIPPTQPRPSPDVLLTELADGTGVLLHLRTKFYYALNRTGVAVWKLLAAGRGGTPEVLSGALAEQFEGTPAEAQVHVEALLRELQDEGLLLPPVGSGPGTGG
jgi:hypothetical protein